MCGNEGRDAAHVKPQLRSIKSVDGVKQLSELDGGNNDTDARRPFTTLQCAIPRPHCQHHT